MQGWALSEPDLTLSKSISLPLHSILQSRQMTRPFWNMYCNLTLMFLIMLFPSRIFFFSLWGLRNLSFYTHGKVLPWWRDNPKQSHIFFFIVPREIRSISAVHLPPHVKSWLIGKESDAGKDWGQEEKGTTWVWVNSGSCWWTGRPGVLQFMGSQRVGHDWATELNWTDVVF